MIIVKELYNRLLPIIFQEHLMDGYAIGVSKTGNIYGLSLTFVHNREDLASPVNISGEVDVSEVIELPNGIEERISGFLANIQKSLIDILTAIRTGKELPEGIVLEENG